MNWIHQFALSVVKSLAYLVVIFIGTFWILRGSFPTPNDVKKTINEMRDLQDMTTSTLKAYKQKQSTVKNGMQTIQEDLAAVEAELNVTRSNQARPSGNTFAGQVQHSDSQALQDIKKQLNQIQSQLNEIQFQIGKSRR